MLRDATWEWSPEGGSVVERWSSFDVMSPATDRGPASSPADWLHANSLAIGPRGNVVVSFLLHRTGRVPNMTYDSATATHYSRGLEIALDPVAHTAHKVWDFRPQPDIWTPYVGSDRLLPNGDRLVSFGLSAGIGGGSGPIAAYEVSGSGAVPWRLQISGPLWNYRTTPLAGVGQEVEVSRR